MGRPLKTYDELKLASQPSTEAIVRQNVTQCGAISHDLQEFARAHPLAYRAALMLGEAMTIGDVARELDVTRMTLYRWLEKFPEMLEVRDLTLREHTQRFEHRLDELATKALRKLEHEMELGGTCARWATMAVLRCLDRLPKLQTASRSRPTRVEVIDPSTTTSTGDARDRALPAPDAH